MIKYKSSFWCGQRFNAILNQLIIDHELTKVCDVGGGANPIFTQEFINQNKLDYSLLDISQLELDKAPESYKKYLIDVTHTDSIPDQEWDLVFSQQLAEHISDGEIFHANIFKSLKPHGYAVHLFPTLYAVPFVLNKYMPERAASALLNMVDSRDRYQHDKFPAYYSWCYGPTKKMISQIQRIGYKIITYQGLIGHRYYISLPPLYYLHTLLDKLLLKFPNPYMTSYAIMVLQKPVENSSKN